MKLPRRPHRDGAAPGLVRDYADDLRLFDTGGRKLGLATGVIAFLAFPFAVSSPFWTTVALLGGIFSIGALGLNLLTGYTGQVSLGHAFFVGVGAYVGSWMSRGMALGPLEVHASLPLWLAGSALVGGVIGLVVGPFALRLRGNYLVIVTLGLVFLGEHLYDNWESFTGGTRGTRGFRGRVDDVAPSLDVGPVDFGDLHLFGQEFSRDQGLLWVTWAVVALVALMMVNIVRTRPGRALQAVRDRDLAAEIIGVEVARYKIGAFALSSAIAAMAGALLGAQSGSVSPINFTIFLSIQFVAMIIVGGVGTVFGSVLGAVFLVLVPEFVKQYSDTLASWTSIPGTDVVVVGDPAADPLITTFAFNRVLFGLFIIGFLVLEPRGLAAMWQRAKLYFRSWPFSY